jgi:tetratricopeptide (TPR) repeat protein
MTFDKTKAMRNAEKYLSQGKIRSAIGEYELVVMHDSRDFGTLNTLGDLYTKSTDIKSAVKCYTSVADHYGKQGFAQKAIAVYNKITKLEPNSIDISLKLAELYKVKGSLNEARAHYETLAEHFQKRGQKIEALAMWKEIALLDPTNTEVYLSLANSYFAEKQLEEALDAYVEAGTRFANKGDHENALAPFEKAMEIKRDDSKALTAFTKCKFALGRANEAAEKLSELLVEFPHNREIRFLLIDSLIEANEIAEAEKAVIKLVEIEPANYPKFLDLAHIYIAADDVDSATRILSMSSEHMLVGGQADDFHLLVKEILAKKPDQLDALRLLARFCSWQRDEEMLCQSLIKLAQVAKDADSVDDERFALLQLTMIVPHELAYAERLHEINELHGFEQSDEQENLFDKRFLKNQPNSADTKENSTDSETAVVSDVATESETGVAFTGLVTEVENSAPAAEVKEEPVVEAGGALKLQKEIDSVRFYIENGYNELAEKAITELRTMFGDRSELNELDAELKALAALASPDKSLPVEQSSPEHSPAEANSFDLNDFRNELGLEELDPNDDSDYETHFSTAVAYQEMGLVEDAIKEFQEAISLVRPNDGSRRFFSCANLLGHCFMQQNMPHLALKWFQRTLETSDLNEDEKQGLWYELAGAYEAEGDTESAGRYFEQIYAENVNFRDVSERVKSIAVNN